MHPAGKASGGDRADLAPREDDGGRSATEPDEAAEIRRVLGVESAFGFHVEDGARRRVVRAIAVREQRVAGAPGDAEAARPGAIVPPRDDNGARAGAFPCLDGPVYAGCLGLGCPLEVCWTGGATVSYARKMSEAAHVSAALYLPGAPCHTCAELVEDEVMVPAPRAIGQPGATRAALRQARAARGADAHGPSREAVTGEASDAVAAVSLRRVNCARGLWQHPISLSAFLMKRIPMLDQDEPEQCPGYSRRPDPHPEVVAYLRQRRERARLRRQDRRAAGEEA